MTHFKEINELQIYKGKHLVGDLKRTNVGCEIIFDADFLKSDQFEYFTYTMKKQTKKLSYSGLNLPPFFAGLLPEGLRFKALVNRIKTSEDDLFTLLASIGENTVGDVYVLNDQNTIRKQESSTLAEVDFYELFSQSLQGTLVPEE